MRLKDGVSAAKTADQLDELVRSAFNITFGDADAYVAWAHSVERELRASFIDLPITRLYTERFWRVQGPILRRAWMEGLERELQVEWLSQKRDTLRAMASRFGSPERVLAVLDTHVILHYQPFTDITTWPDIVGGSPVLLVVPDASSRSLTPGSSPGQNSATERGRGSGFCRATWSETRPGRCGQESRSMLSLPSTSTRMLPAGRPYGRTRRSSTPAKRSRRTAARTPCAW